MSGFGEKLQNALSDWLSYKQERGEGYGNLALRSLQAEIRAHAALYGEGAIVQLISLTMSQNWKNLNFEKLKTLPVAGIGATDRQLDGDEIAAIKRMMSSA